ncbi:MAG: energy transducer TonB [Nitrospirales bacterium]
MRHRFNRFWNTACPCIGLLAACVVLNSVAGAVSLSDLSSHHSDHDEDAQIETLPTVHVHGLRLNKDQQQGPVPQKTPWPTIPPSLEGQELDDWLKARILVSKAGEPTVVILQPASHRELNLMSLEALSRWTFLPQMNGDDAIDGEVNIRVHFRTQ